MAKFKVGVHHAVVLKAEAALSSKTAAAAAETNT
jgi:hypothetical protein